MRAAPVAIALMLSAVGCASAPSGGEAPEPPPAEVLLEPTEPVDPIEVEPSGRTLSGVYAEEQPRAPYSAVTWAFTGSGGFARSAETTPGRVARRDAGSYTIDKSGRLVLFVEQRGEARLGTAERLICELETDPSGSLLVRSPEGWTVRLVRSGDEPGSGDATTAGR